MKAAVLGVGYLGRFHAQKWKQIKEAEFVGVFDSSVSASEAVAAELNVSSFRSVQEALSATDIVSIAASTQAHYELVKICLSQGKHVLVEKPICATPIQANELNQLAFSKNILLRVGHIERFNPAWLALTQRIDQLKKIDRIRFTRLGGLKIRGNVTDVVQDVMIHDLDLFLSLIYATPSLSKNNAVKIIAANAKKIATDLWDDVCVTAQLENGCHFEFEASRISPVQERKIEVWFKDGKCVVDLQNLQFYRFSNGQIDPVSSFEKVDPLFNQIQAFFTECQKGQSCGVATGQEATKALVLAHQILDLLQ